jgi:hypothetical protein
MGRQKQHGALVGIFFKTRLLIRVSDVIRNQKSFYFAPQKRAWTVEADCSIFCDIDIITMFGSKVSVRLLSRPISATFLSRCRPMSSVPETMRVSTRLFLLRRSSHMGIRNVPFTIYSPLFLFEYVLRPLLCVKLGMLIS